MPAEEISRKLAPRPYTCGCGRTVAWGSLHLVGRQRSEPEVLELRNCACGSTRAIVLIDEEGNPAE